ncbi:hypothetical protein [Mesorhizobium sp.]|uniref:hypothetical protein n=1 Tax=Mesorhizobium sp. TaxID=1871066 RepID=UPI00122185E2|nr:hypothetical protein [Mesorhizobium sp.]TIN76727.1 MAG: hypothetical protein E5Y09_20765 [Mesorhizobium sp.]
MDARQQLEETNAAITTAALLLGAVKPTLEQFMRESRDMDNFGHITDPTLWMKPERRATEALLKPLYQAALDFLRTHDKQIAEAKATLEKARG